AAHARTRAASARAAARGGTRAGGRGPRARLRLQSVRAMGRAAPRVARPLSAVRHADAERRPPARLARAARVRGDGREALPVCATLVAAHLGAQPGVARVAWGAVRATACGRLPREGPQARARPHA